MCSSLRYTFIKGIRMADDMIILTKMAVIGEYTSSTMRENTKDRPQMSMQLTANKYIMGNFLSFIREFELVKVRI